MQYDYYSYILKKELIKLKNKLKNSELPKTKKTKIYIKPSNDEELYDILNKIVNNFFPTTGQWKSNCFIRPNNTLQSNLRNNEFLANKLLAEANLAPEYYSKVLEFTYTSELFKEKVHEYEQEIVKWQIVWMLNDGENWICDEELGGDLCLILPKCDIAFRKGIVDTLIAMGLDKEAIEEGIEKNADMWRNKFIECAFMLKFEPITISLFQYNDEELPKADPKHKEAWIKMRKYQYYCNHKKSVDLYGKVDDDMLLTRDELKNLNKYLDVENKKRLDLIDEYLNKTEKTKFLSIIK